MRNIGVESRGRGSSRDPLEFYEPPVDHLSLPDAWIDLLMVVTE